MKNIGTLSSMPYWNSLFNASLTVTLNYRPDLNNRHKDVEARGTKGTFIYRQSQSSRGIKGALYGYNVKTVGQDWAIKG